MHVFTNQCFCIPSLIKKLNHDVSLSVYVVV